MGTPRWRSGLVVVVAALAACSAQPADDQAAEQPPAGEEMAAQPTDAPAAAASEIAPEIETQLAAARQAVATYAERAQSEAAGYTQQVTDCRASEQGGQGLHFGNPALVSDGAQLDALQPEVLMYEPQADGSLRFVGFEYIIPRADWTSADAPTFLGQQMKVNEEFDVWVLHAWVIDNPNGTFADWNPNVSCPAAG